MSSSSLSLPRRAYYRVKPFLPARLRWSLRRWHASQIHRNCADRWPIDESAGLPPEGWKGWPQGKRFAFVLTHDVESRVGLERVRHLAELEMDLGFRSSFNFVPEGDYEVPGDLLAWLEENGFEVGVHDLHHDGRLFSSRELFCRRADKINRYLDRWGAVGFRGGFMLRNLDWLHDLNLSYDASTFDTDPFEPQPDGCGSIFPFLKSSERNGGKGDYVELPYTLPQDSTLFLLLGETTPEIWKRKLDWIADKGGMALPIIHPDYARFEGDDPSSSTYPVSCYGEFLDHVATSFKGHYWHALPREVATWYRSKTSAAGPLEETTVDLRGASRRGVGRSAGQATGSPGHGIAAKEGLRGRRVASVVLSDYPNDPRPRRAAEALVAQGMEVEVICVKRHREDAARLNLNGVSILRLPMQHKRGGKLVYAAGYLGFLAASFAILAMRSVTRRYALVHVHNMPDVLVFSALVPRLFGAKVVLDLHDPMPELMQTIYGMPEQSRGVGLLKFLEKLSIGFADAVITVNKTCKKLFSARSTAPDKVSVVMNSPDEGLFSLQRAALRPRAAGDPFVVMYHGSLVERNGLALAVDAMAHVHKNVPEAELHVFGHRTPFLEEVMESVRDRKLDGCVRYMGARRIEEIIEAIDSCDVGIVPNLRNIFTEINTPTRIFEFLSRGKPVVAPSAPGVREFFREDDLVSFELGNAEALAERIEFVARNPEKVLEITRRGQEVGLAHCWSREQERLTGLVRRLLDGNEPRRREEAGAVHG